MCLWRPIICSLSYNAVSITHFLKLLSLASFTTFTPCYMNGTEFYNRVIMYGGQCRMDDRDDFFKLTIIHHMGVLCVLCRIKSGGSKEVHCFSKTSFRLALQANRSQPVLLNNFCGQTYTQTHGDTPNGNDYCV